MARTSFHASAGIINSRHPGVRVFYVSSEPVEPVEILASRCQLPHANSRNRGPGTLQAPLVGRDYDSTGSVEYLDRTSMDQPVDVSLRNIMVGRAPASILHNGKGYRWRLRSGFRACCADTKPPTTASGLFRDRLHRRSQKVRCANLDSARRRWPDRADWCLRSSLVQNRQGSDTESNPWRTARHELDVKGSGQRRIARIPERRRDHSGGVAAVDILSGCQRLAMRNVMADHK